MTGTIVIEYDKGFILHKVESKHHNRRCVWAIIWEQFAIYLVVRANGQDLDKGIWWYIKVKGQVLQGTRSY